MEEKNEEKKNGNSRNQIKKKCVDNRTTMKASEASPFGPARVDKRPSQSHFFEK